MNPSILSAASHTALKARIEAARNWSRTQAGVTRLVETKAHMEGRAWAFEQVLGWLKEETK